MLTPTQIEQAKLAALELDLAEYERAVDRMRDGNFEFSVVQEAFATIERLKNKHHGMPPCALEGITAAFERREAQEMEDCERANLEGTR